LPPSLIDSRRAEMPHRGDGLQGGAIMAFTMSGARLGSSPARFMS
jgi:hypothetical protein